MKMDIELFRALLLDLTDKPLRGNCVVVTFDSTKPKEENQKIAYHYKLLEQAGFIGKCNLIQSLENPAKMAVLTGVTYQGQDFLLKTQDKTIWEKTKEYLSEHGIGFSIQAIVTVANKFIAQQLANI